MKILQVEYSFRSGRHDCILHPKLIYLEETLTRYTKIKMKVDFNCPVSSVGQSVMQKNGNVMSSGLIEARR